MIRATTCGPLRARLAPFVHLLLAATLALAAAAAAGAAPNRGVPIRAGDTVTTAIAPAGDLDTFVFDAFAGSTLNLTVAAARKSDLRPTVEVRDPSGAALDLEGSVKAKQGKVTVKKLALPSTGRHAIVVGGVGDSAGGYQLKTSVKPAKKRKVKGIPLPAGEAIDLEIPGSTDVVVKAAVRDAGGGGFQVLSVLDPDGAEVPGARESFLPVRSGAKATFDLVGRLGDFVVRLSSVAGTTLDVTIAAKAPKVARRKLEVSPLEPAVAGLEPDRGRPGHAIDVTGENFVRGDGLRVLFGGVPATYAEWRTETLLRVGVPAGEGEVVVTVENPDGQSGDSPAPFVYIPPAPAIASAAPAEGVDTGGTVVDVFGAGMANVRAAALGGSDVLDLEIVDAGHLRFTTPPHAPGVFALLLTDEWGQPATLTDAFTFCGVPVVETVAPPRGSPVGGTEVTLTGRWFHEGGRVLVDGVAAPAKCDGRTGLVLTTPPHAPGPADIRVEDPWGRSTVLAAGFEYAWAGFADETGDRMPANYDVIYAGRAVGIGDLDGDGDRDVVLGRTAGTGTMTVTLLNDGAGEFTYSEPTTPPTGVDAWEASSLGLGDLDGDGDLDLVITCGLAFQPKRIEKYWIGSTPHFAHDRLLCSTRVFRNDGKGGFTPDGLAIPFSPAECGDLYQADSLVLGDVDGDADLDLVLTSRKSVGEASFTEVYRAGAVSRYFSVAYEDDRPATRVLLNDGEGRFSDATSTAFPPVGSGDMLAGDRVLLGDVDGDSDLDIVLTGDGGNLRDGGRPEYVAGSKTRVMRNDGDSTFTNVTSIFMPATAPHDDWGGRGLALGDLDGDGRIDLLLAVDRPLLTKAGAAVSATRLLRGTSQGFEDITSTWMPEVDPDGDGDLWRASDVRIADPEGDGVPDLFLVSEDRILAPDGSTLPSLRRLGGTTEPPLLDLTASTLPDPADREDSLTGHAVALGDLDGDEDLDLVLTSELAEHLEEGARPTRVLILE